MLDNNNDDQECVRLLHITYIQIQENYKNN
jgi:hypothetical protein